MQKVNSSRLWFLRSRSWCLRSRCKRRSTGRKSTGRKGVRIRCRMSTEVRRRLWHLVISRWRRTMERKIRNPGRGTRLPESKMSKKDRARMRKWRTFNRHQHSNRGQ